MVNNIPLAIILAFLSHYLLDLIPHYDYHFDDVDRKNWRKMMPNIAKVTIDFCLGAILILLFSKNQPIIYVCAFFAALPDGFTVLNNLFPNKIMEFHRKFHIDKVHFLKDNKKISNFWRILSEAAVVIISIILLKI
jgi:hypothetical protein